MLVSAFVGALVLVTYVAGTTELLFAVFAASPECIKAFLHGYIAATNVSNEDPMIIEARTGALFGDQ